jgi:hypothetical protein
LKNLTAKSRTCVEIRPRWPDRHVLLDDAALERLCKAQAILPPSVKLIVTRAYQPEKIMQRFLRTAGRVLFLLLYPARRGELSDIFGHNGHAADGTHVDVGIRHNGRQLSFLPLGVFTPEFLRKRREEQFSFAIAETRKALAAAGFRIHRNPTEASQIHCDLMP